MNFLSSGGFGDAFIVMLKISEWGRNNLAAGQPEDFDWLHVESNDILKPLQSIWDLFPLGMAQKYNLEFKHDPNYVQNIATYTKDRKVIPTPVRGTCDFYQKEWPLENPFLDQKPKEKQYDIVLQARGGFNNDRKWFTSVPMMAHTLASMGRHITVVGTGNLDLRTTHKVVNLVGLTTLRDCLEVVSKCNVFIGLSGLLNYFASASKILNIHVIESEKHEIMYYHPEWAEFVQGIRLGTLQEVVRAIKLLEKNGE